MFDWGFTMVERQVMLSYKEQSITVTARIPEHVLDDMQAVGLTAWGKIDMSVECASAAKDNLMTRKVNASHQGQKMSIPVIVRANSAYPESDAFEKAMMAVDVSFVD